MHRPIAKDRQRNLMQLPANANAELVFGVGYANRRIDDELELHLASVALVLWHLKARFRLVAQFRAQH